MSEEEFILAERYLAGAMPAHEAQAFEQRLLQQPELAQAVALMRKTDAAVQDADALHFLQNVQAAQAKYLQKQEQKQQQQKATVVRPLVVRWWWAAAVLALLAVAGWFLFKPAQPTPQALFAANFTPYEAPGTYRNDSSPFPDALRQAFQAYDAGNYQQAQPIFARFGGQATFGTVATFYRAQCLLATGAHAQAAAPLAGLAARNDHVFTTTAQWYLALAYLGQGQQAEAKQQLMAITADPNHPYQQQAKALLGQL